MGPLKTLNLGHNGVLSECARAIAECPALAGLTKLFLYGIESLIGAEGVRALANSPYLAQLRYLDPGHAIGDEGAQALAASPFWRRMTELTLNSCNIGPEGIRALAGSPVLDSVESLSLAVNPIGSEGACALAESPHLGCIKSLDVSSCALGKQDIARLRERFGKGLAVH